jgi:hypothetical protein
MFHWAVQECYDILVECPSWSYVKLLVVSFLWDGGSSD